jgi:DsbC/DsbD-like thiol-disulfide interchange protein/cytochrome c biogenesis protein CcdA
MSPFPRIPTLVRRVLALVLIAPWLLASGAHALGPVHTTPHVEARLISESERLVPGGTHWVALRLRMQPGWHTYWENPGDAGLATTLDWRLPAGFEAGPVHWSHPERFTLEHLVNYGYSGETWLLTAIDVPDSLVAGEEVDLELEAGWLACAEVCIPERGEFRLSLPVDAAPGAPPDPRFVDDFATARSRLPVPSPWAARYQAEGERFLLAVAAAELEPGGLREVAFYPRASGIVDHSAPQEARADAEGLLVAMTRSGLAGAGPAPGPLEGVLVVTRHDGVERAYALSADPDAHGTLVFAGIPIGGDGAGAALGLLVALALAFAGGLLLNLMPCVLPVVSIKAMALLRHGGDRGALRLHGLVFTAGVLVSFAVVAAVLIAIRAAGVHVGWGFQLQSPIFVTVLAYVIFALGLVLSGVLPVGGRIMGIGSGLADRGGAGGTFFTGVLAVVVATPCTAPFMGAAMGFALTQPWWISLAVFQALALGMALPYLAIGLRPSLARWLPRPGAWMVTLRQALAFPLYATVVWLVWVVSRQAGPEGVAAALSGILLVGFAAWWFAHSREAGSRARLAGSVGAAAAVVLALGLGAATGRLEAPVASASAAVLPS